MSKITHFFKQTKKNCDKSEENIEKGTIPEQFYGECLTAQVHSCDKVDCINTKATLKSELKAMQEKCRNIKEAIEICAEIVADKDSEIQNLLQKLAVTTTEKCVGAECLVKESTNKCNNGLFNAFQSDFNADQLSYLRSVNNQSEKDSHFVKTAMEGLYDGRLNALKNKSVTGRSKAGQTKEKMTPAKHSILAGIYKERILTATQDSAERVLREKKLNKYIKDAIHNITKLSNSKELQKKNMSTFSR